MPEHNVIQEYLVSLGFSVDHAGLRRFEDSLKRATVNTEHFAKALGTDFVKAGVAVGGVLAAIGTGLVGMTTHFANQDLQYQIFARQMFIGTDAARKMK